MFRGKLALRGLVASLAFLIAGGFAGRLCATTVYYFCDSGGGCAVACAPTYSNYPERHIDGYDDVTAISGTDGCSSTTQPAPTCDPGSNSSAPCGTSNNYAADDSGCTKPLGNGVNFPGGCSGS